MFLKRLTKTIFDQTITNIYKNFPLFFKPKRIILCYHRLCTQKINNVHSIETTFLDVKLFEEQLKWLSNLGRFVPLDELTDLKNDAKEWQITITFDDGYRDIIDYGLPLIQKYKAYATVFVSTLFVEDKTHLPWWDLLIFIYERYRTALKIKINGQTKTYNLAEQDERVKFLKKLSSLFLEMGREEADNLQESLVNQIKKEVALPSNEFLSQKDLKLLAASEFITIGSHGVSHTNLAKLSPGGIKQELFESKKTLQNWINKKVDWFAYPYGRSQYRNDLVAEYVVKAGYKGALTTDGGYVSKQTDPYQIPRIGIDGKWEMTRFKARILAYLPRKKLNLPNIVGLIPVS